MNGRFPWLSTMHPDDIEELRATLTNARNLDDAPPNIGKRVKMNVQPSPVAGNVIPQDTQLISMRVNRPRQWVVTLMQPVRDNGVQPWASDFDAGTYSPPTIPPASVFSAPSVSSSSLAQFTSQLRVRLRWGAGGVTYYTQADWPMNGGAFGVVADTFDLDALVTVPAGVLGAIPSALVPTIGAFMCEGVPTDPTPLRWLDRPGNPPAGIPAGQSRDWSVKPYARKVRVISAGSKVGLTWITLNDNGIAFVLPASVNYSEAVAGQGVNALADVPAGAEILRIGNGDAAAQVITPEWWIGLV